MVKRFFLNEKYMLYAIVLNALVIFLLYFPQIERHYPHYFEAFDLIDHLFHFFSENPSFIPVGSYCPISSFYPTYRSSIEWFGQSD